MGITISLLVFATLITVIVRYAIIQSPLEKTKSSWVAFGMAIVATTICTLLNGGEQQSTLITGFATMIICYNILCR